MIALKKIMAALFALLIIVASCSKDENPVGPEENNHISAAGCVIKQGDENIVRAEKGSVTGQFVIEERVQSILYTFWLIADDGKLFQPTDPEITFAWSSSRPEIADIIQFETDGNWGFHVKGFEQGSTSIVFKVLHGDHEDFVSLDIPVKVTANAGGGLNK